MHASGYDLLVQAGHIHLHACMQVDMTCSGNLQYSLASHTLSAKGVACETYTYIIGIYFLCTTVSHYYRETCFKLVTCVDFSVSDSGDYQFPDHQKRSYADLDYKITEGLEISDFGKDFEISVKISKDFNQKRTRFQGVSSPSVF